MEEYAGWALLGIVPIVFILFWPDLGMALVAIAVIVLLIQFGPDVLMALLSLIGPLQSDLSQTARDTVKQRPQPNAGLLGREGVVVQTLRPLGRVEIDGQTYECRSDRATIDKGARVLVTQENPLTVKAIG